MIIREFAMNCEENWRPLKIIWSDLKGKLFIHVIMMATWMMNGWNGSLRWVSPFIWIRAIWRWSAGAEPRLWAMIEVCEIPEALYSTDDSQLGPGLTFCELSGHSSAFVLQTQS